MPYHRRTLPHVLAIEWVAHDMLRIARAGSRSPTSDEHSSGLATRTPERS
jgi:hypothetical protein